MNGKKILTWLIGIFVVINVLLLGLNYVRYQSKYQLTGARVMAIEAVLSQRGVSIECEVSKNYEPKYAGTLSYLGDDVTVRNELVRQFFNEQGTIVLRSTSDSTINPGAKIKHFTVGNEVLSFDKSRITYTNNTARDVSQAGTEVRAKRLAEQFVERLGKTKAYQEVDVILDEEAHEWKIIYYQNLEGSPVFDLSIEMIIDIDGVKKALIYLGEIKEEGIVEIYPLDVVLFGIDEAIDLQDEIIITDITLGYKRLEEKGSIWGEKIVPMYKIDIKGLETPLFVNAYTNEMVK